MDTFVDSSWYYVALCLPGQRATRWWMSASNYWMPVDQYIGGIEHAILHLLYSRFWTKVMRDLGLVDDRRALRQPADPGHGAEPKSSSRKTGNGRHRVLQSGRGRGRDATPRARAPARVLKADGAAGGIRRHRHHVEVEEQRRRSAGADRAVRRRHRALLHDVRRPPEQTLEWSDAGVEGAFRFLQAPVGVRARARATARRLPRRKPHGGAQGRARREMHAVLKQANYDIGNASSSTPWPRRR